jgi:hypothetical protein
MYRQQNNMASRGPQYGNRNFAAGQANDWQNVMFDAGMMGQEYPVKVAPKAAISGTPTVVPPPVWVGRMPIPMNQKQSQADVLNLAQALQNGYVMPNMYVQQNPQTHPNVPNQFDRQHQQMQQGQQTQHNDPTAVGNVSAAWRRRQRRRAQAQQRNARPAQNPGGNVSLQNTMVSPTNNLGSPGNMTQDFPGGSPEEVPRGELLVGDPHILVLNNDLANEAIEMLENGSREERNALLKWIMPIILDLALSVSGCRVVQAAVEVAGGENREQMTNHMHGHVPELLDSMHGNHVLQKCIEVLPPDTVQFVVNELCAFPDGGRSIAKHRFGCRILERLLEHCPPEQNRILVEDVIENAYALCKHPFGNYVVQHVLEYGTPTQRNAVVDALLNGGVMQLAMHRVASNVIERALMQCNDEGRRALVGQLVTEPEATLVMASSRYGSFIAQRLLDLPASPQRDEVWRQLSEGLQELKTSKHGKQLVASIAPEEAETESGSEDQAEGTEDS